jgi:hypothetical protein
VCEPSAAIRAPWDSSTIVVADNELHRALVTYGMTDDGTLTEQRPLPLPKDDRPRDIEALTTFQDDLIVVGSHSRNSSCEVKRKRRRIRQLRWDKDAAALVGVRALDSHKSLKEHLESAERCVGNLFSEATPKHGPAVCEALVQARKRAHEDNCQTLNIEGAITLDEKIWVGLRSPLVDGKAVALRLVWPSDTLLFDRVALLNLSGQGVRAMALGPRGDIWGIAGPALDSDAPFTLWRTGAEGFEGDVSPRTVGTLPTSSEGLIVTPSQVITVIDGAEGDEERCDIPARQFIFRRDPDTAKPITVDRDAGVLDPDATTAGDTSTGKPTKHQNKRDRKGPKGAKGTRTKKKKSPKTGTGGGGGSKKDRGYDEDFGVE